MRKPSLRVQVVLSETERVEIRREAAAAGMSISAWMREAAIERMSASAKALRLDTLADLRAFFAECDAREEGREPDWDEHRLVIDESRSRGAARS